MFRRLRYSYAASGELYRQRARARLFMSFNSSLFSLSVILLVGLVGGELLGRLKLPKVTGWIGTGIVLRAANLEGLQAPDLVRFAPLADFVLGYISFTVGATLHLASLRNAGKRLALLVGAEALLLPLVVVPVLIYLGGLDAPAALLLGAIAIAGAPGTTVLVVNEARARGVLTKTLIAAVGLIDMVAVGVFVFVTSLLKSGGDISALDRVLGAVALEFGIAGAIGFGVAALVLTLQRTVVGPAFVGPMMVTAILAAWGLAQTFGGSSILACTFAGVAVSNLRHETARAAEAYLKPFGGVLFVGFYTLAGMRLNFAHMLPALGLVALYFLARLLGKFLSAYAAMTVAGATEAMRKYLGIALLPHGGVAVGLILVVEASPSLEALSPTVAAVGLAALSLNQLVGPSVTRFALHRSGEAAMDRPRLLDFLAEQHIMVGVNGRTVEEVVRQLTDRLYQTTDIPMEKEDFVAAVLERDADESTCLGRGFMIPHVSLPEGKRINGVLGLSADGIALDTPDGRRVHAVVLLATPETERQRHLEILAAFATAVTEDPNKREQLYAARSAAHAFDILHAEDSEDLNYFLDEAIQRTASTRVLRA